ncbi:RING-H2 finger protein ATL60 [Platanthera guangdongensis]|uniref:RING-type E3 ubiquitin transferase n=1 Tax=Platanthera guangdongensis TaxID=2320717 RepID=A0ABR2N4E6_9ASPA
MGQTNMPASMGFRPGSSDATVKVNAFTVIVAMVVLFGAVILVILVYLYVQHYWRSMLARRWAQLIFAAGELPAAGRGLDPEVLRSLPVTLYKPGDFKEGIECAVCLAELAAGDEARLLEKCGHGFHLECIDMWLGSHTTCPVCRCSVGLQASVEPPPPANSEQNGRLLAESSDPRSDSVLWGNQNHASGAGRSTSQVENSGGSSGRMLAISIPVRSTEGFSPSPLPSSSRSGTEEVMSPAEEDGSTAESKLGSLRRLLSGGKRAGGSSCSTSRIGDFEQGMLGSAAENTARNSVSHKSP